MRLIHVGRRNPRLHCTSTRPFPTTASNVCIRDCVVCGCCFFCSFMLAALFDLCVCVHPSRIYICMHTSHTEAIPFHCNGGAEAYDGRRLIRVREPVPVWLCLLCRVCVVLCANSSWRLFCCSGVVSLCWWLRFISTPTTQSWSRLYIVWLADYADTGVRDKCVKPTLTPSMSLSQCLGRIKWIVLQWEIFAVFGIDGCTNVRRPPEHSIRTQLCFFLLLLCSAFRRFLRVYAASAAACVCLCARVCVGGVHVCVCVRVPVI